MTSIRITANDKAYFSFSTTVSLTEQEIEREIDRAIIRKPEVKYVATIRVDNEEIIKEV